MPAAVAIPALISAGTSVAGGLLSRSAAKNAAKAQSEAAERAAKTVLDTAGEVTPWVLNAGERAATDATAAAERAAQGVLGATGEANRTLGDVYRDVLARIEPYAQVGARSTDYLGQLLAPEGEFNRNFSMEDYQEDPGYKFRLEQGQKALERSGALRGMLNSGQTLKALTGYAQGMASQEYQNAFNRFMEQRAQRYRMLSDLAGMGQRATQQALGLGTWYGGNVADNLMRGSMYAGDAGMRGSMYAGSARMGSASDAARLRMGAAESAADAYMGRGNAEAAGHVGAANAWNRMLGGLGQTAMDIGGYYQLRDLIRPPSASGLVADLSALPVRRSPAANPLLWPTGSLRELYPDLFRLATANGL
jgi:hypothetical protein